MSDAELKPYDLRVVRFTLRPNQAQVKMLESHVGAVRFTYNKLLGELEANRRERQAQSEAGVPDDELPPWLPNTPFGLAKFFNTKKDEWCVNAETGDPWWQQNSTFAYESACVMLGDAYQNFFKSLSGKRRGPRMGPPRFKSRRDNVAVTFRGKGLVFDVAKAKGVRPGASANRLTLPKIGSVRVFENVVDTVPFIFSESTTLQRVAVRKHRGRWVASALFRVAPVVPNSVPPKGTIALDLGAMGDGSNIIIGVDASDEIVYRLEYPESLRVLDARKRMLQKRGRNKVGGERGVTQSARYKAHQAKIAKIDHTIANIRESLLHEATDYLTREYSVILIEGLSPKKMMKSGGKRRAHMNRLVGWSSFATIRTQLEYKAKRTGSEIRVAPEGMFTNRLCSTCGDGAPVRDKLHYDQRFVCTGCGTSMHRSVNTARLLRAWGSQGVDAPVAAS